LGTHLGNIDSDCFPFLHEVLQTIPDGKYSLIGHHLNHEGCGSKSFCPPAGCGKPLDGNLLKYSVNYGVRAGATKQEQCWSYPQGAFYLLSRALTSGTFANDGPWRLIHEHAGYGDVFVGWSAIAYAREAGIDIVSTWNESIRLPMWIHPCD